MTTGFKAGNESSNLLYLCPKVLKHPVYTDNPEELPFSE
jgi:hypothetical protein